ncbi:unnamed protein product [Gulo gulo]|uniref:Uncharacterized protein n=1 Tax=Gulo gulo TaxID=48420 RepID=A0A9X9M6Z8_GULGU|nr:unnamed protein product [Gulo gulo]
MRKPRRQRCRVRAARCRTRSRMLSSSWCRCSLRNSCGGQAAREGLPGSGGGGPAG